MSALTFRGSWPVGRGSWLVGTLTFRGSLLLSTFTSLGSESVKILTFRRSWLVGTFSCRPWVVEHIYLAWVLAGVFIYLSRSWLVGTFSCRSWLVSTFTLHGSWLVSLFTFRGLGWCVHLPSVGLGR